MRLASKREKSVIMTLKKMSLKNQEKSVKNTESVENISQMAPKQTYKQTNFKSMNKSEIVHISVAFLLVNVLEFFSTFSTYSISALILSFFNFEILQKIFMFILALFRNFEGKHAQNG